MARYPGVPRAKRVCRSIRLVMVVWPNVGRGHGGMYTYIWRKSLFPNTIPNTILKLYIFRQGLDSHVLRFFARLDTNRPIDMDRTFIISFFLSDDTISVFEPEKRNSGIVHGKFIERSKVKKPSGEYYQAEVSLVIRMTSYSHGDDVTNTWNLFQDLYVGAIVNFRSHQFIVTDADEYALTYAEKHQVHFLSNFCLELSILLYLAYLSFIQTLSNSSD